MPLLKAGTVSKLTEKKGILGCINDHDGSGYIHALLEAYHPGYSRLTSNHYRTNLAKSVRIGALPSVLRSRYGTDKPLCKEGCTEAKLLFGRAIAYGSPLPRQLLKDYAAYLGVGYRLYDANLQLIEEVTTSKAPACNIIAANEDEYHLAVTILPSKRGDKPSTVRYSILS